MSTALQLLNDRDNRRRALTARGLPASVIARVEGVTPESVHGWASASGVVLAPELPPFLSAVLDEWSAGYEAGDGFRRERAAASLFAYWAGTE